jgi:hypothetical protein
MSDTPRDLTQFAGELRALVPEPGRLNRDALMFKAGQASTARPRWFWPSSTALLGLGCLALTWLLISQPKDEVRERIVYVPAPVTEPAPQVATVPPASVAEPRPVAVSRTGGPSLWHYRQQVLQWGAESVPPLSSHGAESRPMNQLDLPGAREHGMLIGGQAF